MKKQLARISQLLLPPPAVPGQPQPYDPRAWVTPEDLNVAPALLGLPLATPGRRFWAMAIDLLLLAPLSNLGNFFLLMAGGTALLLWIRRPSARPGVGVKMASRLWRATAWLWLALCLPLGVAQAWDDWREAPAKHGVAAAPEEADRAESSEVARLQAQLKEAQAHHAPATHHFDPRAELRQVVNDIGLSYFWALVYFSLLPVLWPGQTLGKKLLGLRVVELTGKTLTPMICFKRYGGYAAGMATGMMGFAQLIWDSNRQAIQDKTAHTVVIDARSSNKLSRYS